TSMVASSWQPWTASIRATSSTSCNCSRTRGSRPVFDVLSWFTSPATIFKEMTVEPVGLDALLAAREQMARELQQGLTAEERRFLLSLVAGEPDWSTLRVAHLQEFPGLRWKLQNLARLRETNRPIRESSPNNRTCSR